MVTSGIDLWRSVGSKIYTPEHEFMLAIAMQIRGNSYIL